MNVRVVCFHNPDEINGYLSNWYLSDFKIDNFIFSSMEQYMMYQKAIVFWDTIIADKIISTNDVRKIKAYGREVKGYNDNIWSGVRQIIVYRGLLEKFRQNEDLRDKLLATGNDFIAECAVRDKIWGIGISMSDSARYSLDKWKGQNLLGYSLMQVREVLRYDT